MKKGRSARLFIVVLLATAALVVTAAAVEAAECETDQDCAALYGGSKDACTPAGLCVACQGDPGSGGKNPYCPNWLPYCLSPGTSSAQCVECLDSSHCTANPEPICTANVCVPCYFDQQCLNKSPGLKRCGTSGPWLGWCVPCLDDSDCPCEWPMYCDDSGFIPRCKRESTEPPPE